MFLHWRFHLARTTGAGDMARTGKQQRPTAWRSAILAVLLLGAGSAGCQWRFQSPPEPPPAEPSGGRWVPIVLPRADAIPLDPPPAAGSAQASHELRTLRLMQEGHPPEAEAAVRFWSGGAVIRWNEIARDLVSRRRTSLPMASRVYALLSVAQYDAAIAAWHYKYLHVRRRPDQLAGGPRPLAPGDAEPSYPCAHATIGAASAAVLAYLYPDAAPMLEHRVEEQRHARLRAGLAFPSDVGAGAALGAAVGKLVVAHARADGADAVWNTGLPRDARGRWTSSVPPLLPLWGRVRPWLMASAGDFVPPAPPLPGSREFDAALAAVRRSTDLDNRDQLRMAALWADGAGSYTPSGRWNKIAADRVLEQGMGELRAARVFALLNTAVMDAGIACWETKYRYLLIRPSQADPRIPTPVGLPNFPAYTSAHAALSGAAATVLGHLFPAHRASLWAKAEEAAVSRQYGGIHYPFDARDGLAQGRSVAQLAVARARADGSP